MVKIALYKGKGKIGNALVRWWKNSPYSHCELVIAGQCFSSSIMDGGVRQKEIDLAPDKWDVFPVRWADAARVLAYFNATDGQRYSWVGLLWSQVFARERDELGAAFCSEWCAAALGIPDPQVHSPGTLGNLVLFLNSKG